MQPNVADLGAFYRSPPGVGVQAMVARRLQAIWPTLEGRDVLGLGYALPYFGDMPGARRLVLAMPAQQGVEQWPATGGVSSLIAKEDFLPFADASFDRMLIIHGLEEAHDPARFLQEARRVLTPQGRLVLVVPNRAGLWAHRDISPFGHGRAYTHMQVRRLLHACQLRPAAWTRALYAPLLRRGTSVAAMRAWEQAGEHLWPPFGGVIMVEAVKDELARPKAAHPLLIPVLKT